jgi:hypothetical protein
MEQIELTGFEIYELNAQLIGIKQDSFNFTGFLNEKGLTEGTKRFAARIHKKLVEELKTLNESRLAIQNKEYEAMFESEVKDVRIKEDSELMCEKIKIDVEKLDFSKVENLSLSENYQFLYEKLFK